MRNVILSGLLVALAGCGSKGTDTDPQTEVPVTETPGSTPDAGTTQASLTWYRDVLPVVQDRCQGCHVEGGIAPFALGAYADAYVRHQALANAVATRRMPPWPADDSCIPVKDSRRLSQLEIDVITQWSATGAAEGDPKDAPPPPEAKPALEWVDLTLDAGEDYLPNAAVSDDYRCFLLPPGFAAQQDIIGYEVVPGTPTQVHHAIIFHVPEADAVAADNAEAGLGWTCYGGTGTPSQNVRMVGGWAPGNGATALPSGTGVRVPAGNAVVLQVHYNLESSAPIADRTSVKLQLAKTPVARPATIFPISQNNFQIPANSTGYSVTGTFALPTWIAQATLYGVTPHMHQLGTKLKVRNVTSGQCLSDIPDWDFHWQQSYQYEVPVTVSGGQTFEITCTWDNPGPSVVTFGEGSSEEMCMAFFYATMP